MHPRQAFIKCLTVSRHSTMSKYVFYIFLFYCDHDREHQSQQQQIGTRKSKIQFSEQKQGGPVLSGCGAGACACAAPLLLLLSLPTPEPEELLFERGYIRARQQPFYKLHHQQSVQNSLITYSLFDAYQRPKLKAFLKSESNKHAHYSNKIGSKLSQKCHWFSCTSSGYYIV